MTNDDLSWFFAHVKNVKTLGAAEEKRLIIEVQCGNQNARETLIWHNIPLIVKEATSKARKHRPASMHYEELLLNAIQEGVLGLSRAIEEFDVSRGFRLSTFAIHYIRDAVNRILRFDVASVKPVKTLDKAKNTENFITNISALTNFDQAAEEEMTESITQNNMLVRLREAIGILTDEERYIIERRYGFYETTYTYGDLAKLLHISMERVRQIENSALKRLFVQINQQDLRKFVKTQVSEEGTNSPETEGAPFVGRTLLDDTCTCNTTVLQESSLR